MPTIALATTIPTTWQGVWATDDAGDADDVDLLLLQIMIIY